MKKRLLTGLWVCLALTALIIWLVIANQRREEGTEYEKLVKACKKLRLGNTQEQVYQIMGPPFKKEIIELSGSRILRFDYPGPSLSRVLTEILIDAKSHRIERIICNDEYFIADKF